jgi:hypothetical protein
MIKILAYKYPSSADVVMQRTIEPMHYSVLQENIQNTIKKLLFEDKYNYLLIGLVSKMFICESVNDKAQVYSSREVKYHPHESWILKNK